jgi:thiamine-phosphate pyrophosphorylase
MNPLSECRLYGILDTGYVEQERLVPILLALIEGGIDILQLRAKRNSQEEILAMAREVAPICRAAGVPFILNDYPELVQETGANGAHVGQDDLSVAEARCLAGPGKIIGKSTHSPEQASAAALEHPDYLGFGPLFATPTKPDYTPIGTEDIRSVHAKLELPIFCIGGIKLSNLSAVISSGARRVVIVSDLLQARDPEKQTAACKELLLNC